MKSDRDAFYAAAGGCLVNNIWNDEMAPRGRQRIEAPHDGVCVWHWDWQSNPGQAPASYPALIVGNSPWNADARSASWNPRAIGALSCLLASHDYELRSRGRCNVAYNLWLVDGSRSGRAAIRTEVMVWLEASGGVQPHGRAVEQNAEFALYAGARHAADAAWDCYSFVLRGAAATARIDLARLLRQLTSRHRVDESLQLADVELGTEIWDGRGRMTLSGFQLDLR